MKKVNKEKNNVQLNKIIRGNPLQQDDFTENDEIIEETQIIKDTK